MPSVNSRADVTVRTRPEQQAREDVREVRPIEVEQRQQAVPVEVVNRTPTNETIGGHVNQEPSFSMDDSVSSAVSSLPGGMQQQARQQVQPVSQTQQVQAPQHFASIAGFAAPMDQQTQEREVASRGVPMLDVSNIVDIEKASARPEPPAALAAMNARMAETKDASIGGGSVASRFINPVPTERSARNADRAKINQRLEMATNATEDAETQVEAAATQQQNGRPDTEMNRPSGWQAVMREPRLRQPSTKRHVAAAKAAKNRAARAFNNEGVGYHVYGKVNGDSSLNFRDVGVGSAEIYAAAQQNPEMLERLASEYVDNVPDIGSMSITQLMEFINGNDIWVATFKPPDNRSQDAQSRMLRVMESQSRGIYLHPVMAAMYTADFDGDDMTISFDPSVEKKVMDPMEQIVDIFGDQTLNTDFLYVARIYDTKDMSARRYVREVMLKSISQADGRTVDPLIDAILRLGDTEDKPKLQSGAWRDVFYRAREISDKLAGKSIEQSNLTMSRILKDVFDNMYDLSVHRALDDRVISAAKMTDVRSYADKAFYEVIDGMSEGKAPNNFQDLKIALTGYLGDVAGKNAPFRFTSDVGKVTKMDERLQVGNGDFVVDPNNDEQMRSLFTTTMKYAESYRMAIGFKKAGKSTYNTQVLRERVISEVGFPLPSVSYMTFIDDFVESYSTAAAIINQASSGMTTGMAVIDSLSSVVTITSSNGGMTASDIAGALIDVYGTHSIGKMFPHLAESGVMTNEVDERWKGKPGHVTKLRKYGSDVSKAYKREYEISADEFWVTNRYSQWSLRKFAHENRMLRGYSDIKLSRLRNMNDANAEMAVLMAIADKATGTASKFNEKTYGMEKKRRDANGNIKTYIDYDGTTIGMTAELLDDIGKGNMSERALWVNDDIDALITSNPDMFAHFNMDSPAGFLASPYSGRMLASRNNLDVLGGIRLAMVAEWRMERITALKAELDSIPDDSMARYTTAWNNLQLAMDELGAASEVWHGIIRELEMEDTAGEKSVFQMMREDGTLYKTSVIGERYEWTADGKEDFYYARSFWQNPGSHDTLLSVINDMSMGVKEKMSIIADVVRYWENDAYLNSYEVGFQMEIGNDSSYSLMSQGQQGALKSFREFEQAFNHWGKVCQERLQKDVNYAAKKYRRRKGSLMSVLNHLNAHPEVFIEISDNMYADGIMSSFDKTYAQSEKAKQQPWTNQVYESLSTQWNGGMMNDVERTNDRLLGCQSIQSVGVRDIVRVLCDPSESIEVYDDYGRISDPITRDDLIRSLLKREPSLDVESDIWDILIQNPRIASAVRIHSMSSLANMEGKAYLGSRLSIAETIETCMNGKFDPATRTKFLLRDFPGYPALISLATPAYGSVTRMARERVAQTENYLSYQIASAAVTDYDITEAAKWILGDLGITQESLRNVMKSDWDKYLEQRGLPVVSGSIEETNKDADDVWVSVLNDLTSFIEEVRKDLPQGMDVGTHTKPANIGIDISSVASYWDVMQEFNGAKTAVSTGIEGGETHKWAEWSSHMRPRDTFANLKAEISRGGVNQSWNGLWTSEGILSVGEDGSITIGDKPLSDFEDEIVSMVPEGYVVRDKSTSRKGGTPVPSLFAYMVSKRSNGAETFNLKAKKSGRDATNSVIKMKDRYKMIIDPDTGEVHHSSIADMRVDLQEIIDSDGLLAAQLHLARLILAENQELGYSDLTLANYMCIAELMVRQDENGVIILRSLPMLFEAIKNRIGADSDTMNDEQLTKAVQDVVNDTSETAVGRMTLDPSMVFDGFQPRSKSASSDGIRPHSSSFERNYDLLSQIERDATRDAVLPMSDQKARRLSEANVGRLVEGKYVGGVRGVSSMFDRSRTARGYRVVGYAGSTDRAGNITWTIGPMNAVVIGDGDVSADEVQQICDNAWKYGMTVMVSMNHLSEIPAEYAADAVPCSEYGDALLPMFDIRLNGSEATPYNGGRFATFQIDPSRYVLSVEDPLNYFKLGDAQYKPTEHFANRVKNIENDSQPIYAEDLFPNVFKNPRYENCDMAVSLASGRTISRLIASGVRCTIDYGMVPGGRGWNQRVHDVDAAIARYQQRWGSTDGNGIMTSELQDCGPGDIVAWAECAIIDNLTGEESYVLAPIIPFPLHGSKRGPETFSVQQVVTVEKDNTVFAVDWTNVSDVTKSNAKYFDSSGGANKGMMSFANMIKRIGGKDLTMRDGTPVDNYIAKASTDSRKVGTDRRVKTMISLMTLARLHGYNFANVENSFPDNPDIKERLQHERILTGEWKRLMEGDGIRFSTDPKMDAFLRFECNKILAEGKNPSDYLAESFIDENGVERHTRVMWEFEAMFERGIAYEDQLLRFLHSMDDTFCPNGLDDAGEYMFRLKPNAEDFDRGVLEMEAPYPMDDGNVAYSWANVYIGMSFFGEEYSGFSRPNVSGASNFMDAMNTYSHYGLRLDERSARFRQMWATSMIGRMPDGGAIGRV